MFESNEMATEVAIAHIVDAVAFVSQILEIDLATCTATS
jgi:hypothetical protein